MKQLFNQKKIFIFDAFGTLFKTSSFETELEKLVGSKSFDLIALWRRKQLEYTWLYNQMQQYIPFDEITKLALEFSMRHHKIEDEMVRNLLLPIYDCSNLIEGTLEALSFLKKEGKTVVILSNGTPTMLQNGIEANGITHFIDHFFSVDSLQIYKPHPSVYQMALDELKVGFADCLFFSSNQWDVAGASTFGLDSVWVNQYGEVKENLPYGRVWEIEGLKVLV
ncbi:MAG: haloacid dehalogenase type II [Chitinophagales bacterium]